MSSDRSDPPNPPTPPNEPTSFPSQEIQDLLNDLQAAQDSGKLLGVAMVVLTASEDPSSEGVGTAWAGEFPRFATLGAIHTLAQELQDILTGDLRAAREAQEIEEPEFDFGALIPHQRGTA